MTGDPALLFTGPAHVHRQDDGPEPRGRQQRDDMVGIVAERHADDVARPRADILQMAGGLGDQGGELRIGDRMRAIDDRRVRGMLRASWKIASETFSQPCGPGTATSS